MGENLIEEFKAGIKETILNICKKRGISEYSISYKIDFNCDFEFKDDIKNT